MQRILVALALLVNGAAAFAPRAAVLFRVKISDVRRFCAAAMPLPSFGLRTPRAEGPESTPSAQQTHAHFKLLLSPPRLKTDIQSAGCASSAPNPSY